MKITIITPSFNQAQFLEQTIDSVLSQKYHNLEYIIIDGGSQDRSVEIIKKHEKYLKYWVSEKDRGQSHAINKGLSIATGEIVNWLNSDDYYQPNALNLISELFADPKVSAVCAKSNIVASGEILKISSGTDVYGKNISKTIGWARIDQPETFFRASAYRHVGLLNENLHYIMDKEWWSRYLIELGLDGVVQSNECLVNFRLQPESKTMKHGKKFNEEVLTMYHSLASKSGCLKEAENLSKNFQFLPVLNHFSGNAVPHDKAKRILNYFILKKADEAYYQLDLKLSKKLLSGLDTDVFANDDLLLFDKLRFRSSLPAWLIKKFRE